MKKSHSDMRGLLLLPKLRRLAKNNRPRHDVFGDNQAWIDHVTALRKISVLVSAREDLTGGKTDATQ